MRFGRIARLRVILNCDREFAFLPPEFLSLLRNAAFLMEKFTAFRFIYR
jgi:hypothetical protein